MGRFSMLKIVSIAAVAGCVGVASLAFAEEADPIKARQADMKAVGASAKVLGGMLDGSVPYDAAKAQAALAKIQEVGTDFSSEKGFAEYFPATSKEGDTTAAPAIWEKSADFKTLAKSLATDAAAAIDGSKKDEASFKAAAGKMFGNCKSCHETFRIKKG